MRNTVMTLLLLGAMLTFSSSRPMEKSVTPLSGSVYKEPIVLIATISQTWYNVGGGGCNITISMPIAFIFDSETLILQGILVSNYYQVTVNCGGGGVMYIRPASDVNFSVSDGKLQDVSFQSTGNSKLDLLYSDNTFKQDYMQLIKNNQPTP
jgi:hypothetical protein